MEHLKRLGVGFIILVWGVIMITGLLILAIAFFTHPILLLIPVGIGITYWLGWAVRTDPPGSAPCIAPGRPTRPGEE